MGHISFVGKLDGETLKGGAPAIAPGWTLDLMAQAFARLLADLGRSARPEKPRDVGRKRRHRARNYKPNNEEGHKRLHRETERADEAADANARFMVMIATRAVRAQFVRRRAHSTGRCRPSKGHNRFGNDPKTSGAGRELQSARTGQSYVVDGSFFRSSGAVNPALTIMANALRVGEHLIERIK